MMSMCAGSTFFAMTSFGNRFISYAAYTAFYLIYTIAITIARYKDCRINIPFIKLPMAFNYFFSAEIAKQLPEDSYGLIFGVNTFLAYWMQIILTLGVATDIFDLNLSIINQFNVYGCSFGVFGLMYFVLIIIDRLSVARNKPMTYMS